MHTIDRTGAPLAIGVLLSGGGTTLENLVRRIDDGRLRGVRIAIVLSSRKNVRGVEIARSADLPVGIVHPRDFPGVREFSDAITAALATAEVQLAVMAGFLSFWQIPPQFAGRVLNIHPALLPDFGGSGMYGERVHAAVLRAGRDVSGCTVHVADNTYDHGPIVAQRRVPVLPDDTVESLAARVGGAERELYPEVLQNVADRGLSWLQEISRSGSDRQRPR